MRYCVREMGFAITGRSTRRSMSPATSEEPTKTAMRVPIAVAAERPRSERIRCCSPMVSLEIMRLATMTRDPKRSRFTWTLRRRTSRSVTTAMERIAFMDSATPFEAGWTEGAGVIWSRLSGRAKRKGFAVDRTRPSSSRYSSPPYGSGGMEGTSPSETSWPRARGPEW